MFRTKYEGRPPVYGNKSIYEHRRDIYEWTFDSDGIPVYAPCSSEDVYEQIQSLAQFSDYSQYMSQILKTPVEVDVLDGVDDCSEIPVTPMEQYSLISNLRQKFDKLPSDKKSVFNNSFEKFLKDLNNYEKIFTYLNRPDSAGSSTAGKVDNVSSSGEEKTIKSGGRE